MDGPFLLPPILTTIDAFTPYALHVLDAQAY